MAQAISVTDRFWGKVDRDGPIPVARPELGPCWLWLGGLWGGGYGRFVIGRRRDGVILAHLFSYVTEKGPIPVRMEVDHLCRVRSCVNPKHLEAVTHSENVKRGDATKTVIIASAVANAKRRAAVSCKHGHMLNAANTHIRKNGTRSCKPCSALRTKKWRDHTIV